MYHHIIVDVILVFYRPLNRSCSARLMRVEECLRIYPFPGVAVDDDGDDDDEAGF